VEEEAVIKTCIWPGRCCIEIINTDYVKVYDDILIVLKKHVKFFNILIFQSLVYKKTIYSSSYIRKCKPNLNEQEIKTLS